MPFFYLADTAWNGGLLSTNEEWEEYLADRAARGFTAIQLITHAPWTAALADREGRVAYTRGAGGRLKIDEQFYDRMDEKLAAINRHGMLAAPVLAWAANFGSSGKLNIGHTGSAADLIELAGYQVRRFAQREVMWILAGDGRYGWWTARKWRRVGRAVFGGAGVVGAVGAARAVGAVNAAGAATATLGNDRDRVGGRAGQAQRLKSVVAIHPMGGTWPYRWFEGEAWLDVCGYQSSHSEDPKTLKWLQSGPPATYWKSAERARPTINLEPVYEGIAPGNAAPFGRQSVRRAVWWSLLNAPTAGVAYGAHGLWGWHDRPMETLNHAGMGIGPHWREAMKFPGAEDMARVARFFGAIEWWRLRPDSELASQTSTGEPMQFIAAARSDAGDLAVAYLPAGGLLKVNRAGLVTDLTARWFDPRTGEYCEAVESGGVYRAPREGDWVWVAGGEQT